jgi:hypothetical protein
MSLERKGSGKDQTQDRLIGPAKESELYSEEYEMESGKNSSSFSNFYWYN